MKEETSLIEKFQLVFVQDPYFKTERNLTHNDQNIKNIQLEKQ